MTQLRFTLLLSLSLPANGFTVQPNFPSRTWSIESALSAGMGMAVTKGKNKKAKGKKKGGKAAGASPFDAHASLMKMEKLYEELMVQSNKSIQKDDDDTPLSNDDLLCQEYIVAARSRRSSTSTADLTSVSDWIPVASMAVSRPLDYLKASSKDIHGDELLSIAVSYYCREISAAAIMAAPKFRDVPRTDLLYSLETYDSFTKHVCDSIQGSSKPTTDRMTKAEARKVLGMEDGDDMADLKSIYRKRSFQCHPDRFAGQDRTPEEEAATSDEFSRVKNAYDALSSGVSGGDGGRSWYESLGGRERTDFCGPITLSSIGDAKMVMDRAIQKSAVVGLDPGLVQMFVVRNQNNA